MKFFRRSADAKVIKVYINPGPCFQLIFSLNYSIELNLLDLYCHKQSDKNQSEWELGFVEYIVHLVFRGYRVADDYDTFPLLF